MDEWKMNGWINQETIELINEWIHYWIKEKDGKLNSNYPVAVKSLHCPLSDDATIRLPADINSELDLRIENISSELLIGMLTFQHLIFNFSTALKGLQSKTANLICCLLYTTLQLR